MEFSEALALALPYKYEFNAIEGSIGPQGALDCPKTQPSKLQQRGTPHQAFSCSLYGWHVRKYGAITE